VWDKDPTWPSRSLGITRNWRRVDMAGNEVLSRTRQLSSGGLASVLAWTGLRIAAGNLDRRNSMQLEGTRISGTPQLSKSADSQQEVASFRSPDLPPRTAVDPSRFNVL
jgi:hypothetical protein